MLVDNNFDFKIEDAKTVEKRVIVIGNYIGEVKWVAEEVQKRIKDYRVDVCRYDYDFGPVFYGELELYITHVEGTPCLTGAYIHHKSKKREKTLPSLLIHNGRLRYFEDLDDPTDLITRGAVSDIEGACKHFKVPFMRFGLTPNKYEDFDYWHLKKKEQKDNFIKDLEKKIEELGLLTVQN